jgi:DNA-binding transcriptional LysR family regulator
MGVLKVAASPVQIETVFSTFLHQYSKRYPKVQVKLIEAIGSKTLALLERGEVHLGISLLQSIQADDRHFGIYPVPPVELIAACHPSIPLETDDTIDIRRVVAEPLLLLDSGFVVRKTFDTACRLARLKPNILFESAVSHNLLAFAEAGLGIAVIPSVVQTHRYALRVARILQARKPLREPLAVVWDKRRALPQYVRDFCESLAAHMREFSPPTRKSLATRGRPIKRPNSRVR